MSRANRPLRPLVALVAEPCCDEPISQTVGMQRQLRRLVEQVHAAIRVATHVLEQPLGTVVTHVAVARGRELIASAVEVERLPRSGVHHIV